MAYWFTRPKSSEIELTGGGVADGHVLPTPPASCTALTARLGSNGRLAIDSEGECWEVGVYSVYGRTDRKTVGGRVAWSFVGTMEVVWAPGEGKGKGKGKAGTGTEASQLGGQGRWARKR